MSSRWLIVAPVAVLVTGALFFLMRSLISGGEAQMPEVAEAPEFKLTRDIKDPPRHEYDPLKPPKEMPPEVKPVKPNPHDLRPKDGLKIAPLPTKLDVPVLSMDPIDGQASPIIRPTEFPSSCAQNSGEAVIDFVVEPDGSVGDVRVVRASSSCFGKAAERDARRWRYRPQVVDGRAVRSGRMQVVVQYVRES